MKHKPLKETFKAFPLIVHFQKTKYRPTNLLLDQYYKLKLPKVKIFHSDPMFYIIYSKNIISLYSVLFKHIPHPNCQILKGEKRKGPWSSSLVGYRNFQYKVTLSGPVDYLSKISVASLLIYFLKYTVVYLCR